MRDWYLFPILILLIIGVRKETAVEVVKKEKQVQFPVAQKPIKPVSTYVPVKYPPVPRTDRRPASTVKSKRPSRALSSLSRPQNIKVGKSYEVLTGVYGLKKEIYKPSVGKKVSEDNYFVYYQSDVMTPGSFPVALNPGNQKIYPLSPILHIKGADQELRDQLKAEGMREFYYHPRLQLLSVQSTPSLVLSQYQALLKRGMDVRLEVLKDPPKSK